MRLGRTIRFFFRYAYRIRSLKGFKRIHEPCFESFIHESMFICVFCGKKDFKPSLKGILYLRKRLPLTGLV